MALLNFLKPKNQLEEGGRTSVPVQRDSGEPEKKCPNCHREIPLSRLWANDLVCPCGYHFRMKARQRIQMITDKGSFHELYSNMKAENPLSFPGYNNKIETVRAASREIEAVVCGTGMIGGQKCCLFVMEPYFMMGSMGSAVGEKITALFEYAVQYRLPVIGFTVSGGARMQEGLLSLMQMAKTSAAVKRHSDAGLVYIAVLTDPTTGGVTASFAMEADIILAEPGATVGFAGARVIEQTTKKALPKGFQTSEFVLEHGFIDSIIPRFSQKKYLTELLKMHSGRAMLCENTNEAANERARESAYESTYNRANERAKERSSKRTNEHINDHAVDRAYERVKLARDSKRPTGLDYIKNIFKGFIEFHGDRRYADDPAVAGGIANLGKVPVTVIAIEKGHTAKERTYRNFGMPKPEGYRKALRLMKQAEKFGRPVICFVDTSGAYCGIDAEERGQGQAIAENLLEMSSLCVPIISILIGEGGSGGALALAAADRVWMLQNAVYSVISPEGCASILWKDSAKADTAAACLKLTAEDGKSLGVIERILSENEIGKKEFYDRIRDLLAEELKDLSGDIELTQNRYDRFRRLGTNAVIRG